VQRDAPELLPLADHVNDGLIAVGFEILDLEEWRPGEGCSLISAKRQAGCPGVPDGTQGHSWRCPSLCMKSA